LTFLARAANRIKLSVKSAMTIKQG
jgi:hypothetical protein